MMSLISYEELTVIDCPIITDTILSKGNISLPTICDNYSFIQTHNTCASLLISFDNSNLPPF